MKSDNYATKHKRVTAKIIALSHRLPDEKLAKRFLQNFVRFKRICQHRPMFKNSTGGN